MADFTIPKPADFEPPKYLSSLIQAVNDGAKLTQTGALGVAAAGVYLLAIAFSISDEDLLLEHPASFANIGVQVSPQVAFGVAPWVFVGLHIFTILRYAMLVKNLEALKFELHLAIPSPASRDRCMQLLTNDTFVMFSILPKSSKLYSRFFGIVTLFVMALVPIFVLIVLQLTALRLQNSSVLWAQRLALAADISVLLWFYWRTRFSNAIEPTARLYTPRKWTVALMLILAPGLLLCAECAWVKTPSIQQTVRVASTSGCVLSKFLVQPVDKCLCPATHFGCRYIGDPGQLIIEKEFSDSLAKVRTAEFESPDTQLAGVKGVDLESRSLISANFPTSELYGANFYSADLSKSDLTNAILSFSNFTLAHLNNANLTGAGLMMSDFTGADLSGTILDGTDFRGSTFACTSTDSQVKSLNAINPTCTNFKPALLRGADFSCYPATNALRCTSFTGIDLSNENLQAAEINNGLVKFSLWAGVRFDGDDMHQADLHNEDLSCQEAPPGMSAHRCTTFAGSNLQGIKLTGSGLSGASFECYSDTIRNKRLCTDLTGAHLEGADLSFYASDENSNSTSEDGYIRPTYLEGISLRGAYLECDPTNLRYPGCTDLSLTDLEGADLSCNGTGASKHCTDLTGAILEGADLSCRFDEPAYCTNLAGATLKGANLTCLNSQYLKKTHCTNLTGANLQGADLTCVRSKDLKKTICPDLTGAITTGANFDDVKYETGTIWPDKNFVKTHPKLILVTYQPPTLPAQQQQTTGPQKN